MGLGAEDQVDEKDKPHEITEKEVVKIAESLPENIDAAVNVTIKKDNKITIESASSKGVTLSVEGIKIGPTNLRSATITPNNYSIDVGRFLPNIKGDF